MQTDKQIDRQTDRQTDKKQPHLHPGINDVILWFYGIDIFTVVFMVSCYYDHGWGIEFLREIDNLWKKTINHNNMSKGK